MREQTDRLLFNGLQRAAKESPTKEVAIVEGTSFSYQELDASSDRLAAGLQARGVKRGDRVAIYMDNTWPCIVSLYGVSKIGAVFLIVNPQTKQDKLEYILDDCQAKVLLTDGHLSGVFCAVVDKLTALTHIICSGTICSGTICSGELPSDENTKIKIEPFDNVLQQANSKYVACTIIPNDLCALIYTSGSTGNPKGVMHTHLSMVFALGSLTEYLRLSTNDRILNLLPLAFDYGLYQLLMSVWMGATIVLERSFTYPAQIINRMKETEVTVFPGVPTVFSMLLSFHKNKPLNLNSVTRVTNTAAALPADFIPKLKEIFPNALIFKMYGLTECKRVAYLEPELLDKHPTSVGKAMPGTEVFLLDEQGKKVSAPGEGTLYVRGPHLMLGYWNKPDLSEEMLKNGELPGEKWLCTKDHFFMDAEGFLYFRGRQDDIIKSRGEKVSPVEVENALYSIPGIREAAIIGVKDELLGQAIKAFVAIEQGSDLCERKIKKMCMAKLENFMVPKEVVIMDELPKTTTGKITKKGLGEL